jgi:HK97 family phage portal protein
MELQTGIFGELLTEQRDRLAVESRSSLENPQTPLSYPAEWLLDIFNGGRTDSGIRVSQITAFQVTAFCACVDFISSQIASLPKHVFERTIVANGRASHRLAYEHDYYDLIGIEPNDEMSRFVFDKACMVHVLGWGNSYAELQRDAGNAVTAMWPRNPYKTRPHRVIHPVQLDPVPWRPFPVSIAAGELVYITTDGIEDPDTSENGGEGGKDRIIPKEDMLHVPGLSFDGRIGQDIVWLSRQVLGLALATEKFGAKYFANYAKPGGFLTGPALKPEDREKAKQSWQEAQGGENAHKVAFMPPGFDFKEMGSNATEAQLTEAEEAQGIKICSRFHLPPRVIGLGKVTSRSNTEQESQEIISYALNPWTEAWKLEYKRKLFPNRGIGRTPKNKFFIDFDYTGLQRADAAAREAFYASGRQWGYLSTNDIRAFEKLNPIEEPWAEDYWMPINMTLAQTPLDPNSQDGAGNGQKDGAGDKEEDDPVTGRYVQHYSRLFRDAFGRVLTRENRDMKAISAAFGPCLYSIRDGLFDLAAGQMRLKSKPGIETDRFITDYLGGMVKRSASWVAAEADDAASTELRRAIRALRLAAWREAASLKAKAIAGNGKGEEDEPAD